MITALMLQFAPYAHRHIGQRLISAVLSEIKIPNQTTVFMFEHKSCFLRAAKMFLGEVASLRELKHLVLASIVGRSKTGGSRRDLGARPCTN